MPLLICPNDQTPMTELQRNGVVVDMCPNCRGVWLDRGELEKLLELTGDRDARFKDDRDREEDRRSGEDERYRKKKRHSLLDFFDF
ncbi:MAG TPA: zf-TFIIB domain-containing protein [Trueperaceae bacterium]